MIKEFEVGKFYLMQVVPNYGGTPPKKVACLCVKIRKRRIWFEHLYRGMDGELRKVIDDRRLDHFESHPDEAISRDDYFPMVCRPEDVAEKPAIWDTVPTSFEGGK